MCRSTAQGGRRCTDRRGGTVRDWGDIGGNERPTDAELRAHLVADIAELDKAGGILAAGGLAARWVHQRNELKRLDARVASDPDGSKGYTDGTI